MSNKHLPDWDWRIWGGSLVTIIWLAGGTIYVGMVVGWAFWHEGAATIGGFFEGFFAPLAFLWLVVGLFIQQKELSRTREEMRQSNVLSAQQANAMEASALTARQQAFFLIAENVRRQAGNILGAMLASSENDLITDDEAMEQHWARAFGGRLRPLSALARGGRKRAARRKLRPNPLRRRVLLRLGNSGLDERRVPTELSSLAATRP